jgi:translation initiation factor 1
MCPECGQPVKGCRCRSAPRRVQGDGIVRIRRETKGRRGKTVTTVSGLELGERGLKELAAELKRLCGCGGAVKDGVLEIQGDHRDRIQAELERRGHRVLRAGG